MSIDIQIKVVCEACGAEVDAYSARSVSGEDILLTVDPCEKCADDRRAEYDSLEKENARLSDENNDLCDQIFALQQEHEAATP